VKGTKMAFAGIPDARKRKDVIAYLKTLNQAARAASFTLRLPAEFSPAGGSASD
jgi:hypothetical protein